MLNHAGFPRRFTTLIIVTVLFPFHAFSGQALTASPLYDDYPLPDFLTLCGEPVPLDNRNVWERLDREFTISVWDRAQVFLWIKRAGRYFPYIEKKLEEAQMPDDIKYLALAESALSKIRPKRCWYCPASRAARVGEHIGPLEWKSVNVIPWAAMASRWGVLLFLWP